MHTDGIYYAFEIGHSLRNLLKAENLSARWEHALLLLKSRPSENVYMMKKYLNSMHIHGFCYGLKIKRGTRSQRNLLDTGLVRYRLWIYQRKGNSVCCSVPRVTYVTSNPTLKMHGIRRPTIGLSCNSKVQQYTVPAIRVQLHEPLSVQEPVPVLQIQ